MKSTFGLGAFAARRTWPSAIAQKIMQRLSRRPNFTSLRLPPVAWLRKAANEAGGRAAKSPSSKFQAPEKSQMPNFKSTRWKLDCGLDAWNFLWSLELPAPVGRFGIWDFLWNLE